MVVESSDPWSVVGGQKADSGKLKAESRKLLLHHSPFILNNSRRSRGRGRFLVAGHADGAAMLGAADIDVVGRAAVAVRGRAVAFQGDPLELVGRKILDRLAELDAVAQAGRRGRRGRMDAGGRQGPLRP